MVHPSHRCHCWRVLERANIVLKILARKWEAIIDLICSLLRRDAHGIGQQLTQTFGTHQTTLISMRSSRYYFCKSAGVIASYQHWWKSDHVEVQLLWWRFSASWRPSARAASSIVSCSDLSRYQYENTQNHDHCVIICWERIAQN